MNKIESDNNNPPAMNLTAEHFLNMVHSSPEAVFVYVDEKIIFANNTALKLLKAKNPGDIIGKDVFSLVLPASRKALRKVIDLVIENRKSYISNEDRLIALDGEIIDIEISSTYFNFNGRDGIQAFIKDITKRKIAEEHLKKSEIEYKAIFESTGTAMLFIEEDKTISLINGECEKISGYSREEIEGKKKWTEFIAPEDRATLEKNHDMRRKEVDIPMSIEFRLIDRFRRYHNAFMTITLIPGTKKSVASIIDLTEIQKAEEILATTQQNYRLLVENTKEAIAIIKDELVCYVNPKLCEITGYTEKQILNKKFYKLVHSDFKDIVRDEYSHRMNGTETHTTFPVKIIDTLSHERWFQINSVLTIWGEKPAVLLFFNDITETKNVQDALMASEEKYRLVAENAKDIIIIYNENGTIVYMNASGYETFGLSREDDTKINVSDILYRTSEFRPPSRAIEEAAKENRSYKNRVEVFNSGGDMIRLETISSPVKLENKRLGMLVIARDITERKKLEKEIILISERIRQQVSRDLHDDLNPHLIGIEALTQVLATSLRKMNLPEAEDSEKIAELINKAITKTHRLARGLCPIDLESTGIQTPIMNLLKLIRTLYGIEGKFNYDESIIIEDLTLATNLYYIAQEAVFNAAKYSGGTSVIVKLKKLGENLILSIEDNGSGLKARKITDDEKSSGMGLKIMKYRAEIIDGTFMLQKNKPSGTIISVKIPISVLKDEGRIFYGGSYAKKQQEV